MSRLAFALRDKTTRSLKKMLEQTQKNTVTTIRGAAEIEITDASLNSNMLLSALVYLAKHLSSSSPTKGSKLQNPALCSEGGDTIQKYNHIIILNNSMVHTGVSDGIILPLLKLYFPDLLL